MDGNSIILQTLRSIRDDIELIRKDGSERGRAVWEKLNDQEKVIALIDHRLLKIEEAVAGQTLTLGQYQAMKLKAEGAGWLGKKLMWVGSIVLGAAGWIYASWDRIYQLLKMLLIR